MKEFELKYGCNPNQKPAKIYMQDGSDLPITILNDPYVMGVMEFAVVRNNLYRVLITSISGLGNSTPQVNSDTPDEGESSIKALLNVKPWVVRDQTNIIL